MRMRNKLAAALILCAVSAFADNVPIVQWDIETGKLVPTPYNISLRRGESVNYEPRFVSYAVPMNLTGAVIDLRYWYTGQSGYYATTGSVMAATGRVHIAWYDALCPASNALNYEVRATVGTNVLARGYGALTILAGSTGQATNGTVYSSLTWATIQQTGGPAILADSATWLDTSNKAANATAGTTYTFGPTNAALNVYTGGTHVAIGTNPLPAWVVSSHDGFALQTNNFTGIVYSNPSAFYPSDNPSGYVTSAGASMTTQTVYDLSGAVVASSNLQDSAGVSNIVNGINAWTNGLEFGPHLNWVTNGGVIYGWTNGPDTNIIIVTDGGLSNSNPAAWGTYNWNDELTYMTNGIGTILGTSYPSEYTINLGLDPYRILRALPTTNYYGLGEASGTVHVAYAMIIPYIVTMIDTNGIYGERIKAGSVPASAINPADWAAATNNPTLDTLGGVTNTPAGIIGAGGVTGIVYFAGTTTYASNGISYVGTNGFCGGATNIIINGSTGSYDTVSRTLSATIPSYLSAVLSSNMLPLIVNQTCNVPYRTDAPQWEQQYSLIMTQATTLAFPLSTWITGRAYAVAVSLQTQGHQLTLDALSITNQATISTNRENLLIWSKGATHTNGLLRGAGW